MQERWKGLAWMQQPQDLKKLIAPLLQASMDVIPVYQACGALVWGRPGAPFRIRPWLLLHTVDAATESLPARQKQILHHWGIYRNWIALSGMGLGGFPLTVLQKNILLLRDFQLWFESLHIPDKCLDASATGTGSELRQTGIDRQYFHLGWQLSGSPLRSLSLQSLIFSAKGKTTSRKKKTQQIFHSSHTELHLEGNLKAFFWVTHASLSLLILPLLIMIFYIKIS